MIAMTFGPAPPQSMDPVDMVITIGAQKHRVDVAAAIRGATETLRDQDAATQVATTLRSLANDLDALAYAWRLETRATDPRSPTL